MVTEIPVFLQQNSEIDLSDFSQKLQACGLSEIIPYEAIYLNKNHQKKCFAFNVEGENQPTILNKLQKISTLNIGKIDFVSIKFCGQGIHCCFAVVDVPFADLTALTIGYISDTNFSAYIMKRSDEISYFIALLDPQELKKLDYVAQFHKIEEWQKYTQYLLEYLKAGSVDFMQVGYYPL